jgi:hypothetical protein
MRDWHTGSVEIGMLRLLDEPITFDNGIQVGTVEGDPLIIAQVTGEVIVVESHADSHILWYVAASTQALLLALLGAAQFLGKIGKEEIDFRDTGVAKIAARECTRLAGGEKYLDFYMMLLGAE